MEPAESVVFVFGLWPDPDDVLVFQLAPEAQAYLRAYLFSERLGRILARQKLGRSQPIVYTLAGQVFRPERVGLLGNVVLVPISTDDRTFQTRLDTFAAQRDLPVPVTDRAHFAQERMREMAQQPQIDLPTMPAWLRRRMPGGNA